MIVKMYVNPSRDLMKFFGSHRTLSLQSQLSVGWLLPTHLWRCLHLSSLLRRSQNGRIVMLTIDHIRGDIVVTVAIDGILGASTAQKALHRALFGIRSRSNFLLSHWLEVEWPDIVASVYFCQFCGGHFLLGWAHRGSTVEIHAGLKLIWGCVGTLCRRSESVIITSIWEHLDAGLLHARVGHGISAWVVIWRRSHMCNMIVARHVSDVLARSERLFVVASLRLGHRSLTMQWDNSGRLLFLFRCWQHFFLSLFICLRNLFLILLSSDIHFISSKPKFKIFF